jgi:hypothetical protein
VPDFDQPRRDGRTHFSDTGDTDPHPKSPDAPFQAADDKRSARG